MEGQVTLRKQVADLVQLGPMPSEEGGDVTTIADYQKRIHALEMPLTTEEARALLAVFGPDDLFGLSWALLTRLETAPDPVVTAKPKDDANRWIRLLWERHERWLEDQKSPPPTSPPVRRAKPRPQRKRK